MAALPQQTRAAKPPDFCARTGVIFGERQPEVLEDVFPGEGDCDHAPDAAQNIHDCEASPPACRKGDFFEESFAGVDHAGGTRALEEATVAFAGPIHIAVRALAPVVLAVRVAAARGLVDELRALLVAEDGRAASSTLGADGRTPLMIASRNGDDACAQVLLAAGAPPDAAASDGWTALLLACDAASGRCVGAT